MDNCRTCIHRLRLSYGKAAAMYCKAIKSNKTKCGYLRCKMNQPSCALYRYCAQGSEASVTDRKQMSIFDIEGVEQ